MKVDGEDSISVHESSRKSDNLKLKKGRTRIIRNTDRQTDRQAGGQTNRRKCRKSVKYKSTNKLKIAEMNWILSNKNIITHIQTDRHTDRQTKRYADDEIRA